MLDLGLRIPFAMGNFPNNHHGGGAVNKADLIDHIAEATSMTKVDAGKALEVILEAIESKVTAGDEVSIFGFGKFSQTSRDARVGRNPQTGEPVKIAASKGVKFTAATAFKAKMNPKKVVAKKAPAKAPAKKKA